MITAVRSGSTMIPLATLMVLVCAATRVSPTIVFSNGNVGASEKRDGDGQVGIGTRAVVDGEQADLHERQR